MDRRSSFMSSESTPRSFIIHNHRDSHSFQSALLHLPPNRTTSNATQRSLRPDAPIKRMPSLSPFSAHHIAHTRSSCAYTHPSRDAQIRRQPGTKYLSVLILFYLLTHWLIFRLRRLFPNPRTRALKFYQPF